MTQKQKENIKHERVLKLKKIGFWTLNIVSYILAGLFLIVLIISLATPKKQNVSPRSAYRLYVNEITEVVRENLPYNVVYDDEDYSITLNPNELNNYTWTNLNELLQEYSQNDKSLDNTTLNYDNKTYSLYDYDFYAPYLTYQYEVNENASSTIYFSMEVQKKFQYYDNVDDLYYSFTNVLTWNLDNSNYDDIKNAIELDIQANESSETESIFESLTNVLTNFITTLNSGVTSVIALFWDSANLQLTLLGNLTTIVIGVAVCFFLFRLVIGLIRLRG